MEQKSPTQELLEAQRHEDIRAIVIGALRKYQARRNAIVMVAADLGVSDTTLYRWCSDLGIDIDDYRRPAVAAEKSE